MNNQKNVLRITLESCKEKFAYYAQYHAAKGSTDKEADNQAMVDMINAALSAQTDAHPPSRHCMCDACAPSFPDEPSDGDCYNVRSNIAITIKYPEEWDVAAYPTLEDALHECMATAPPAQQTITNPRQGEGDLECNFNDFMSWAKNHMGQGYSLEHEEGCFTNPVTKWAFRGFVVGRANRSSTTLIPSELMQIGELIRAQDNRATDQPLFIVQQKRSYVANADHNDCYYEWRETRSGEYVDASPERAKRLENIYSKTCREPVGWKRFAVFDVWEFVTACFTKQGCEDYITSNGHNLEKPRIYANDSYRNHEYQAVRNWLYNVARPTKKFPFYE